MLGDRPTRLGGVVKGADKQKKLAEEEGPEDAEGEAGRQARSEEREDVVLERLRSASTRP